MPPVFWLGRVALWILILPIGTWRSIRHGKKQSERRTANAFSPTSFGKGPERLLLANGPTRRRQDELPRADGEAIEKTSARTTEAERAAQGERAERRTAVKSLVDDVRGTSATRWEHQVIWIREGLQEGTFSSEAMERKLDAVGAEGWELIAVSGERAIFKRPVDAATLPAARSD